jgi:phosphate transport system substrate-binding protein
VVRADGSGTTFIFTNHLSADSVYFKGLIGIGTHPKWPLPNVLKGRGNPGVAALVSRTTGSIGYVEYDYAVQNQLIPALIQNKRGEFVAPSLETANQALATIKFPHNFRVFIPEPLQGYPIVGLTWMLIYKQYSDPDKAKAVKQWINWVLTDGQKYNEVLNYTRIPNGVAHRVLTTINSTVR